MSKDKPVPAWWPNNPYPTSVFPMERDNYAEVVPDPDRRCALSGMLGREFWDIASKSIWAALQSHIEDMELDISPLEPKPKTCKWTKIETVVCPKCGGCGETAPQDLTYSFSCPRCNGTGEIPEEDSQ